MAVLGFAAVVSAQTPILGPTDALSFDYYDADFSTYAVTGFQASWDSGVWAAITTTAFTDAQTLVGATSFQVIPPFKNGQHTMSVRACNAQGCGGGSIPFAFMYAVVEVLPVPGAVPVNLRKVPRR